MEYIKFNISSPLQFTSGGQFESAYPWTHAKRIIDTYELLIGTNKTLYMQQEDQPHEVNPGDIMLLKPHCLHEGYDECYPGIAFDWLHFRSPYEVEIINEEALLKDISLLPSSLDFNFLPDNHFIYIPLFFSPPIVDRVNIQFRQLMHVANSSEYNAYAAHYLLTSLLIEVSEQAVQHVKGIQRGGKADSQISIIMEWVRVHATEKLSAHDVAQHFNYNRDYLSRFFKQNTGINLQEYINHHKLLKAKELLSRSSLTVQQISHEVGVPDEKYFMKLFKVHEGITATEFRRAYHQTFLNKE